MLHFSVFPSDVLERRHIHFIRRGAKFSHRGETVAKIWIEEEGQKKIEVVWSEMTSKEESEVLDIIDKNWDLINEKIDRVFKDEKVDILKIK